MLLLNISLDNSHQFNGDSTPLFVNRGLLVYAKKLLYRVYYFVTYDGNTFPLLTLKYQLANHF